MHYFQYGQTEIEYLKERDPALGRAIEVIGLIQRPVFPEVFTALVRNIVGQQISTKAAATIRLGGVALPVGDCGEGGVLRAGRNRMNLYPGPVIIKNPAGTYHSCC